MSKNQRTTTIKSRTTRALLDTLNTNYQKVHTRYERLFWQSYMGDHSIDEQFAKAQIARENFRSSEMLSNEVTTHLEKAKITDAAKLKQWAWFFSKFQTPPHVQTIFKDIITLEKEIFVLVVLVR